MVNTKLLTLLGLLLSLAFGIVGGWFIGTQQVNPQESKPSEKISLKLPADAKPASRCLEKHGVHATSPKNAGSAEKPFAGPTYVFWKPTGQVIAIEYHVKEVDLKKSRDLATYVGNNNYDLFGANYDHITLTYQDDGHSGYEVPHYDMHVFTVPPAEREKLVCPKEGNQAATRSSNIRGVTDDFSGWENY